MEGQLQGYGATAVVVLLGPDLAEAIAELEAVVLPAVQSQFPRSQHQRQMFSEGDIGVLPPLGVYDPLGLIETRDMRRSERSNRSALDSNEPFSE